MVDDGSEKTGADRRSGDDKQPDGPADQETVVLPGSKGRSKPPPSKDLAGPTVILGSGPSDRKQGVDRSSDTEVDAGVPDVTMPPDGSRGGGLPRFSDLKSFLAEIQKPPSRRLRPEGVIAKGGMGTVELAVDTALKRRVARKVMHPELEENARFLWLFLREARITGQLDHPNIVPVYEVGVERKGSLFFTMKRVEGRPLSHLYRELPPGLLPDATLFRMLGILVKVCDALAFAHSRKVLHCDLKPSNIMVGDFGEVYLMDWGLAREMTGPEPGGEPVPTIGDDALSTSGSVMGTPSYMSPEQADGARETLDQRSDVFGMGAILYYLLARRPPFYAPSFDETVELARRGAFVPPSSIVGRQAVPMELEQIVLKAMATNPDDRYPDVNALKHDLERFMFRGGEFPTARFSKGDHIIHEGQLGESAYIIVSGSCEVYRVIDGARVSIRTIGPGGLFGEAAVLSPGPRTANVVALEDTTVYVVTSEVLERELDGLKPWLASLVRTLADRFRELEQQRGG